MLSCGYSFEMLQPSRPDDVSNTEYNWVERCLRANGFISRVAVDEYESGHELNIDWWYQPSPSPLHPSLLINCKAQFIEQRLILFQAMSPSGNWLCPALTETCVAVRGLKSTALGNQCQTLVSSAVYQQAYLQTKLDESLECKVPIMSTVSLKAIINQDSLDGCCGCCCCCQCHRQVAGGALDEMETIEQRKRRTEGMKWKARRQRNH